MSEDGVAPGSSGRDEADAFAAAWEDFVLAVRRSQGRGPQAPDELSLAQYYLLSPLIGGGSLPVSRLATLAGVSAPTATRIVDGLERAGLLRRERCLEDRRTVLVSLTERGRVALNRRRRQLARRRRALYEQLPPDERAQSVRLLRDLAGLIGQL